MDKRLTVLPSKIYQLNQQWNKLRCSGLGTSLVVQWLGLHVSTAGGMGSIFSQGTKIPQALRHAPPKKKDALGLKGAIWDQCNLPGNQRTKWDQVICHRSHLKPPWQPSPPHGYHYSLGLGLTQSVNDHGLAPSCGPHHHRRVASQHGLKHLNHLIHLGDKHWQLG